MGDTWKTLLQSLLIPIAIAFVGFIISNALQQKQMSLDKLKFTEQVVDDAFTGDNPYKALVLAKLMPTLTDDKAFAESFTGMIDSFYFNKAKLAVQMGDKDAFSEIADAAKLVSGKQSTLVMSLKADSVTGGAISANDEEIKAVGSAQAGQLDAAKEHLANAAAKSPLYRSAKEMSNQIPEPTSPEMSGPDRVKVQSRLEDSIRIRILPHHSIIFPKPGARIIAH